MQDTPIDHYSSSKIRKSLAHFALGKGVGAIIGILWLLIFVRVLSAGEYGIYVGFYAYLELFIMFSNLGLTPIAERFVPEFRTQNNEPKLRNLILKLVSLRIITVLILATGMSMLAQWTAPMLGFTVAPHIFIMFHIIVAIESISRYVEAIFDSLLLQGRTQISVFLRTGFRLIVLITVLAFGQSITLGYWINLEAMAIGASLAITLGLFWFTLSGLNYAKHVSVKVLPLLTFAAPFFGSQILGTIIGLSVVQLLVLKTVGAEASAVFSFCVSLATMLQRYLPSYLLVGMVRPLIISSANDVNGDIRLQRIISIVLKLNAVLVGFALSISLTVGDQLVSLLSGGKFLSGGIYLNLFLIFILTQTLRAIYGHVALAKGIGRAILAGHLAGLVVLGLGVIASYKFGLYAYNAALIAIDLVWFGLVQRALLQMGKAPAIAWQGFGKILLLTLAGWGLGLFFDSVFFKSMADWLQITFISCISILIFAGLGAIIKPFGMDEQNSINRMLPRRLFIW